ncbi:PIG-L family deacetylase [Ruania halotolerans]|uniref:PIG-L family deacetylase n=1 Tax=Ruania halotolerans TaxID=2897773 RepID=UPI001E36C72F|nr:PIG-L family deacetylase [Ruania halotolerans]UFU07493.1 PIG-L family deacetylase [Ruania halotolerans]
MSTTQPVSDHESESASSDVLRVLGAFAHPDDETLVAGGLLAWLARSAEVHVVTATRGERGEVIPGDIAHLEGDGPGLAAVREAELTEALEALGVATHHFLDSLPGPAGRRPQRYVDSGMQWDGDSRVRAVPDPAAGRDAFSRADAETAAQVLAAHLRTVRPHLVLIDEPDGGYGHPDHVRMHQVTMRAAELAANDRAPMPVAQSPNADEAPWTVPVVAWVVRPESAVRAAERWLADAPERPRLTTLGRSLSVPEPDGDLASIVKPDGAVDLVVDTTAVSDRVVGALRAHRSQVQDATLLTEVSAPDGAGRAAERGGAVGWFALSNEVLQPLHARIGLRVAPGWGSPAALRGALAAAEAHEAIESGAVSAGAADGSDPRPDPGDPPGWYLGLMRAFTALMGVVVTAAGTAFHRWEPPFGLLIALVVVISSGVLARSFADRLGVLVHGAAVAATALAIAYLRPGGDVIVTDEPIGTVWLVGVLVAAAAPMVAPGSWFRDGR